MRVFVYEHLTGGGLLEGAAHSKKFDSLAVEGRAMCGALAADLAAIDGVQVSCLRDSRLTDWKPNCHRCLSVPSAEERDAAFDAAAADADWTVVIAPEIGGVLTERCRRVIAAGGRLLGGSLASVELASDKHAMAEHLAKAGVPVPRGIPFLLGQPWPVDFNYPAVWKPRDGAGSQGLRLIEHHDVPVPQADARPGRLEELYPPPYSSPNRVSSGWREDSRHAERDNHTAAASVAFLCGPTDCVSLPPCSQRLAPNFRYLGGALPIAPTLAKRAMHLARRAISSLPEALGYLGVDLVLGKAEDGRDDVVIEINPRLTTSYIGLRAACRENLTAAMLAIAERQPYYLSFRNEPIEFRSDGTLGGWA